MLVRELGFGGIERDVSKFSRHVDRERVLPHVAYFRPGGPRWAEIEQAGIPLLELSIQSFRSSAAVTAARRFARYVAEHEIDLVHAFDAPANMFAVPLSRLIGRPVLSSNLWLRSMLDRRTQFLLATLDRMATGVFVNCQAVATELSSQWGVPQRKLHVCHNGFETKQFNSTGRQRPAELADAQLVIGTVCGLRPEKNLPLLIDAFAEVFRTHPGIRLVIVGDGDEREMLVRRISELGITGAVLLKGATADPAPWMRAMDVFVLPSKKEAFSNALLEAMACGCCPVGSEVGGTFELIRHGEHGMLFPSGDRERLTDVLRMLIERDDERVRMGCAAAKFARENLTIETAANRLATIYEMVVGPGVKPT